MGIFGGNGFQGPGEEFGNSWNSFSTGQGNFMTNSAGEHSNGQGQWPGNNTVTSPMPTARPGDLTQAGSPSYAAEQQQGSLLGMVDGLLSNGLLGRRNSMSKREMKSREGFLGKTLREGFGSMFFGRG